MKERTKLLWLGIFIICAIALAAWFLLFLKPSVGDGEQELRVRFSNIDKVTTDTRVTYAGKLVGEVDEILEVKDPRQGPFDQYGNLYTYELILKVDSGVKIFSYDEIQYSSSGLMGEKSINITPKATPKGKPPAKEITNDILYARSSDKLEETLLQLNHVAESFGETLDEISDFLSSNREEFHQALNSVACAANGISSLMQRADETDLVAKTAHTLDEFKQTLRTADLAFKRADHVFHEILDTKLVERVGRSLDHLDGIIAPIQRGEGTLGRLIQSDAFYLQFSTVMCKIETLLNDINHYGLLFQYDKGWKRGRTARMNKMQQLCTPNDFVHYFDEEICSINLSMNRVASLLQTMECSNISIENECFANSFRELLGKVENLETSLKVYTEMLFSDYCHKSR